MNIVRAILISNLFKVTFFLNSNYFLTLRCPILDFFDWQRNSIRSSGNVKLTVLDFYRIVDEFKFSIDE